MKKEKHTTSLIKLDLPLVALICLNGLNLLIVGPKNKRTIAKIARTVPVSFDSTDFNIV